MAIITLTSDFGLKDHHVAAMKGAILSEIPEVSLIDVSHDISPFNIIETAYIVKNAIESFPRGTVNVIAVDSEYSEKNKLLAAEIDGQYFITSNNGILSFIKTDNSKSRIFEVNIIDQNDFCASKTMIKAACHLARGGKMELIGKSANNIKELKDMNPVVADEGSKIIGTVIYIDNYGNVITNITRELFNLVKSGNSKFEISVRNHKWDKIFNKYNEIESNSLVNSKDGQKLAVFNSSGYLELAIYRSNLDTVGGASTLLGLKYRDTITIIFSKK